MATVPGQAVAPFEQPHLDGGFVATGAHAFIATGAAAAGFICWCSTAGAGNRQGRITVFPVRVAAAAGCRLLRVGPAHRRPATGGWNIGKLVASHDARSISGSSNIIATACRATGVQQCRAAAGSASSGPTRRRRSRRAWGGRTATHLLQHGRPTGSDFSLPASFFCCSPYEPFLVF